MIALDMFLFDKIFFQILQICQKMPTSFLDLQKKGEANQPAMSIFFSEKNL